MPEPEVGPEYGYADVARFYQPAPVGIHFVLVRDEGIVALRIREDYNSKMTSQAPQVWVGNETSQKKWGKVLAKSASARIHEPLPVFVMLDGRAKYTYQGLYEVINRMATEQELTYARGNVKHKYGVSRIVFLKKLPSSASLR